VNAGRAPEVVAAAVAGAAEPVGSDIAVLLSMTDTSFSRIVRQA
jgi:hypothetical protein